MIDIENQLRSTINAVLPEGVSCLNDHPSGNPSFPVVTMVMGDNTTYERTYTGKENHVLNMFQFDVYSNDPSKAKTQCNSIMNLIDEKMLELGFMRTFRGFTENYRDATVKRLTARYTGVVGKNKTIYRR